MIFSDYDLVFIISSIFGAYVLYKFMRVFFEHRNTRKSVEIISYISYFFASSIMYMILNIPIVAMIITVIMFYIISLNYKSDLKHRILAVIFIYIILLLLEALIAICFGYISFDVYSSNPHFESIMGQIVLKVSSYFVVIFLGKYKNIKRNEKMPVTFWFALLFIPSGTICIIIFLLQTEVLNSIQLVVGISIMLAISMITFALYDSINLMFQNKMESTILKQQNKHYLKQYKLIEESIKKTNSLRHDLKKHLQVLESLIENEEKTRAMDYIQEIVGTLDSKKAISQSGNIPIDSILNFKLAEAKVNGVSVTTEVTIPTKVDISDFDFTVILGNLIDNSLEATKKLDENKYIKIKITYNNGTIFIGIENSYDGIVSYEKNKIITSYKNKEEHGFGLENVRNSVSKYDGTLDIKHSDNTFVVNILLYERTEEQAQGL